MEEVEKYVHLEIIPGEDGGTEVEVNRRPYKEWMQNLKYLKKTMEGETDVCKSEEGSVCRPSDSDSNAWIRK